MIKSAEEALSIITEWSVDLSDVKVAYSRPGVAIWFPSGTVFNVWDSEFKITVPSGVFIVDLSGCIIHFNSIADVPDNLKEYASELSTSPSFDIRTADGGRVFLSRVAHDKN
jgi:hypothetical protein